MKDEIKEIFDLYEQQATNPDLAILIKTLKEWYFEKESYKSRIDKAIEYIKFNLDKNAELIQYFNYDANFNKLLNILNGGDYNE